MSKAVATVEVHTIDEDEVAPYISCVTVSVLSKDALDSEGACELRTDGHKTMGELEGLFVVGAMVGDNIGVLVDEIKLVNGFLDGVEDTNVRFSEGDFEGAFDDEVVGL